jgi:hypothetical protein
MEGNALKNSHASALPHLILYRLLPGMVIVIAVALISIATYITSPHAAAKLSTILSDKLGAPVSIAAIRLQGDTLTIEGITVGNPAGFAEKDLLSVDAVRVAPSWWGLLQGRRTLRLLDITGAQISMYKGSHGAWNFEPLRKKISGGKGGAEFFIDDLRVHNSAILINNQGFREITLQLLNVTSKGSANSRAHLAFADLAGNRYSLSGSFRAGADPEAELALDAPSLALAGLTGENRQVSGRGSLQAKATLQAGVITASVAAKVKDGSVALRNGMNVPLSGKVQGSGRYDLHTDALKLESLTLSLDRIVTMQAAGSADRLKSDLRYELTLGITSLDLAQLAAMIPAMRSSTMKTAGRVSSKMIKIVGTRGGGIDDITGALSLHDLLLSNKNRLLCNGVDTEMKIATVGSSIRLSGALLQKPVGGKPLLEQIRAPYNVILSRNMQAHSVALSGFTAKIFGAPFSGSFHFRTADQFPVSLSLHLPSSHHNKATYGNVSIVDGSAALTLDLKGASSKSFSGTASLALDNLHGSSKGESFTLRKATVDSSFSASAGRYHASGTTTFERAVFKRIAADGRFAFRASDDELQLDNGAVKVADTTVHFDRLMAVIPEKASLRPKNGYPLHLTLAGGAVSRGEIKASGIEAGLHGIYGGVSTFTGNAEIAAEKLLWRGRNIGTPAAKLELTPTAATVTLGGTLFGGELAGGLSGTTNARAERVAFDLSLHEADLAKAMKLAGRKGTVAVSGGRLTVTGTGSYGRTDGVNCRIHGAADRIALANATGKELLGDGGISFDATLAEETLTLDEAAVRLGDGVAMRLRGTVAKALSPRRDGIIAYSIGRAPLEKLIDPLINSLPRSLQEAAVSGAVAAEGSLTLHNGHTTLQGSVRLDGIGLDAGPDRLQVTDISGSIPFIIGFPARQTASPELSIVLQRPLYHQHLAQFSKEATKGSPLKIGRIAFGPLEFSDTALRLTAADGIIEARSFSTSLAGGKIPGRGYVAFSQGATYGADLLVNDLSLQQLCALFPAIKGYVSGRVDGIVMLEGSGSGLSRLSGYTALWTRQGNGEKMLVSREFLQKLAGKNLKGFFFRTDRPFDRGEIETSLQSGYLTFDTLDIANTNFFGVRDLKVSVTESQNSIALEHLLNSISQAVSRGKAAAGKGGIGKEPTGEAAPAPAFKWDE